MLVYKITNLITNKVYIGITEQTLESRWKQHLLKSKINVNRHLYNAMNKYGIDSFKIEIVEDDISSYSELLEKEKYYIKLYNSFIDGYNMTEGGDINPMNSSIVKDSHSEKMRSKEVRSKISETMKRKAQEGILFTEEHRKNLSKSAMGNHNFGTGDTRSIGCYCVLDDGSVHKFHSYKEAGKWWFDNYHPFGDSYAECTFQRKIKLSIAGKSITYGDKHKNNYICITNIKWFALNDEGGDNNEEVDKN